MLLVQAVLLVAILAVLLILVRRAHTVGIRAFKRVAFVIFLGATVYAILRPADTTWAANKLGVGRGADLLLYCLALAFFAFAVNTYLRFRNLEPRYAELARAMALQNAEAPSPERAATAAALVGETANGYEAADGTGAETTPHAPAPRHAPAGLAPTTDSGRAPNDPQGGAATAGRLPLPRTP